MGAHHRDPRGATPRLWRTTISHRLIAVRSALFAMLAAGCGWLPASPGPAASIPTPRPISTAPYQVGAYYFPGWPTLEKWKVLDAFPERTPLLGYYREGQTSRAVGRAGRGVSPASGAPSCGKWGLRPDGPLVYW
jgi:hypothetical protein